MVTAPVNIQRFDPYRNFRFRLKWNGKYVAGVSQCNVGEHGGKACDHREDTEPGGSRKSTGRTEYEPITLERGVTHDTAFEQWANPIRPVGTGPNPRKDLVIEVYNDAGQLAMVWKVYRCWVSEFQAFPHFDANVNVISIQYLKLENEGWDCDPATAEPTEPVDADPA